MRLQFVAIAARKFHRMSGFRTKRRRLDLVATEARYRKELECTYKVEVPCGSLELGVEPSLLKHGKRFVHDTYFL
jgi:hypothetical protein